MNILQKHSEIMKSIYALAVVCVIAMAQIAFAADKVTYKGNWSNLAEKFANKKQGTLLTNTSRRRRADIKACAPTNRCVLFIYSLLFSKYNFDNHGYSSLTPQLR